LPHGGNVTMLVFVNRFRKLGFAGPYSVSRHHFMVYKQYRLAITSNSDYPFHRRGNLRHWKKQDANH
jgi:hypothetical protein